MRAKLQLWQRSQPVNDSVVERREAPRCEVRLKVVIRLGGASLQAVVAGAAPEPAEMIGETRNLSETGLAVCVPANRIGNRYLNVAGCKLKLTLMLPSGLVQMHATPKWCNQLAPTEGPGGFVFGLRVTAMDDQQWVTMVRFVHDCLK